MRIPPSQGPMDTPPSHPKWLEDYETGCNQQEQAEILLTKGHEALAAGDTKEAHKFFENASYGFSNANFSFKTAGKEAPNNVDQEMCHVMEKTTWGQLSESVKYYLETQPTNPKPPVA